MPTPYQVPKSGTTDAKFEGENRNISTSAVEGNNGGDGPVAETSAAVEQPMDPMMEGVQQYNISAEAENNDAPSITKVDEHQVTTRTEALHAAAVATLSSFNPHNPSTSNINNNDITEEPKRKEPPEPEAEIAAAAAVLAATSAMKLAVHPPSKRTKTSKKKPNKGKLVACGECQGCKRRACKVCVKCTGNPKKRCINRPCSNPVWRVNVKDYKRPSSKMNIQRKLPKVAAPEYLVQRRVITVFCNKPSKDTKLGLTIVQNAGEGDGIYITSIAPGGLLAGTELKVGMKVLRINGRNFSTCAQCVEYLKAVVGQVTVVALENVKYQKPALPKGIPVKKKKVELDPHAWRKHILEREEARPWWQGLRTQPTRRSARQMLKKSPEKAAEESSSLNAFTDDQHVEAKAAREERAKRRLESRFGDVNESPPKNLIEPPPKKRRPNYGFGKLNELQKKNISSRRVAKALMARKKANYTESDIRADRLLNQPCTVIDGFLTSGYITLTLPPLPAKLGLYIEFNNIFGYAEVKHVQESSPIVSQIPVDFRTDCFITSIESESLGCIVPESAKQCAETINSARLFWEHTDIKINFAKNPLWRLKKGDPLRTSGVPPGERKLCGYCGTEKYENSFSSAQWAAQERYCLDCVQHGKVIPD